MYKGFWEEAEDFENYGFEFMENEYEGTITSAYDFLHGYCTYFAYAYALKHKNGVIRTVSDYTNQLIHAYFVAVVDNKEYYIDIRGVIDDEYKMLDEFDVTEREVHKDWYYMNEYSANSKNEMRRFYNRCIKGFSSKEIMHDAKAFLNAYPDYYKVA